MMGDVRAGSGSTDVDTATQISARRYFAILAPQ